MSLVENNSKMTELNLTDNGLGYQSCVVLSQALDGGKLPLASLNLSNNKLGHRGLHKLLATLVRNKSLTQVKLRNVGCETEGQMIKDVLFENDRLLALDLSWNNLSRANAACIVAGIVENRTLTSLDLVCNRCCSIMRI